MFKWPKKEKSSTQSEPEVEVERRQYKRIKKNFILKYFIKEAPNKKYEITQLKNISKGGMCFITTQPYEPSTTLSVELRTPYLADTTYLEGKVLESSEKITNLIFETRVKFESLDKQSEFLLFKLVELFENEKETNDEQN